MFKNTLRQLLEKNCPGRDLFHCFDPLRMEMDESGKTLRVFFPHAYFSRWFSERLLPDFEKQAHALLGDIHISYEHQDLKPEYAAPAPGMRRSSGLHTTPGPDFSDDSGQTRENVLTDPFADIASSGVPHLEGHTFDTFFVNRKNAMVLEAAVQAVKSDTCSYSPFVLYGKSCTGKTHLLNAMANTIQQRGKRFIFADMDLYGPEKLRHPDPKYACVDAVFLDDAQRLADYPAAQDALVSLIEYFRAAKKLLVISMDVPPSKCRFLDSKLLSWISSGLVLELKKPDLDIRTRYVEEQNQLHDLGLAKENILSIAQKFNDIRLIDGFLTRLGFYRSLRRRQTQEDQETVYPDAAEMLEREGAEKVLTPLGIITTVAKHYALSPDALIGKGREKNVVLARHVSIMLCRELLSLSLPKIGRLFGNRDHSSVLHSIKRIKQLQESNKDTHKEVETVRKLCLDRE